MRCFISLAEEFRVRRLGFEYVIHLPCNHLPKVSPVPAEVEYRIGNGQWALGRVCHRPGKTDMEGASDSQRIFTSVFRRDSCSPLDLSKWKKTFVLVGHMCFQRLVLSRSSQSRNWCNSGTSCVIGVLETIQE